MEDKKMVKVNATMVAHFPRGQWEDEVKFNVNLALVLDKEVEVGQEKILLTFMEKLGLCSMNHENDPFLFLKVHGKYGDAYALNIRSVNYFTVDDWYLEEVK